MKQRNPDAKVYATIDYYRDKSKLPPIYRKDLSVRINQTASNFFPKADTNIQSYAVLKSYIKNKEYTRA